MSTRVVEGVLLGLHAMLSGIGRPVMASRARMHSHLLAVLWLESLASQGRGARCGRFRSVLYPWTWPGESHEGACTFLCARAWAGYRVSCLQSWLLGEAPFDFSSVGLAGCGAVLAVRRLDGPFLHRKDALALLPPLSAHLPPSRYLLCTLDSTAVPLLKQPVFLSLQSSSSTQIPRIPGTQRLTLVGSLSTLPS